MRIYACASLGVCIAVLTVSVSLTVLGGPRKSIGDAGTQTLVGAGTEQRMAGGFWRLDHSFEPTLIITNVLENAELPVVPILYAADGTAYQLPTLTLAPSGVASIDIRSALSEAPAEMRSHFSQFGSVAVKYVWNWPGAASAMVQNRDAKRSLNFNFELRTSMIMPHDLPTTVYEGLW